MKRVYPNSKITLLTSSEIGSVIENNPYIDHIIFHKRNEKFKQLKNLIKILERKSMI